jgi:type II secretory pathway pseudopilin PulG
LNEGVSTLEIVVVAVAALLVLLFIGGMIAAGRRAKAMDGQLKTRLAAADAALAQARAADKGWKRATIEKAARDAFTKANKGVTIDALHLVQVIDKPGVEADEAVFHVVTGDQRHVIKLDRSGGKWKAVRA